LAADPGREDYVRSSLANVQALEAKGLLSAGSSNASPAVEVLPTPSELARAAGTGGACGQTGYINRRSGWADAEATMRWLRAQVEATGRVKFVTGAVERLLFSRDRTMVEGAVVTGATSAEKAYRLRAAVTVLAAGAWTPTLLDLRGIVQATGQVLAYISLSDADAEKLSQTPVQMNMSNGMFVIPPPRPDARPRPCTEGNKTLWLKAARHAHGYKNMVTIPHPEDERLGDVTISRPLTVPDAPLAGQKVPQDQIKLLKEFVDRLLPSSRASFAHTRMCHYADTSTGDFLLSYHPKYNQTLFVATGGSGHGFKFLPVIGKCIVACLQGDCPTEFATKWGWRESIAGEWSTEDGSRGGERGLVLGVNAKL
jgi:sarcosine oxidase/L-pipecolate oxidase